MLYFFKLIGMTFCFHLVCVFINWSMLAFSVVLVKRKRKTNDNLIWVLKIFDGYYTTIKKPALMAFCVFGLFSIKDCYNVCVDLVKEG